MSAETRLSHVGAVVAEHCCCGWNLFSRIRIANICMDGAHVRHVSATDCTSQKLIRGEKVRKHAVLSSMSKGANRVPDRAHDMMSRDSTCRLCVTFLVMSARGTCACGVLER